jgi:para-nitrobenzyl esterase
MAIVASTTAGAIEGREKEGVLRFAGVPYAAPPVGARRFRPPEPVEPWTGTRSAQSFGPASWQSAPALGGLLAAPPPVCDEDCLTLNVQTPALDDAGRPVMVWIHGGSFTAGTGATPWYNGTSFARRGDVVVVSLNYRLGALGFLHLAELGGEAYASSGLNGILDQVAALEWVRDNIATFGGDPGNVTIFGESAGGMSVATILGLPRATGLFHRAIPQSGAASHVASTGQAARITRAFCDELGVGDLEGLLATSPERLVEAQAALPAALARARREAGDAAADRDAVPAVEADELGMAFQPVLDGVELPVPPLEAVRDGLNAGVPVLTGTCRDEWNIFHLGTGGLDDAAVDRRAQRLFPGHPGIVAAYRAERPDATPDQLWCALATDAVFRIPAIQLAEAQVRHQPDHTFVYRFSWPSTAFGGALGACHALEIPFMFNNLERGGAALFTGDGPIPPDLAPTMHDAWWRFARTGDPNGGALPHWAPYDRDRRTTMDFDTEIAAVDDPDGAERAAWG